MCYSFDTRKITQRCIFSYSMTMWFSNGIVVGNMMKYGLVRGEGACTTEIVDRTVSKAFGTHPKWPASKGDGSDWALHTSSLILSSVESRSRESAVPVVSPELSGFMCSVMMDYRFLSACSGALFYIENLVYSISLITRASDRFIGDCYKRKPGDKRESEHKPNNHFDWSFCQIISQP